MSNDLRDQIRELTEFIDASQTQIEGAEVRAGAVGLAATGDEASLPLKRVLIAAAAFVLVLILVGGVAWLVPLGDDAPPATEPTVTTTIATEDAVEFEVLSLAIGPEPRFDISALGREVVFEPSEDDDISVKLSQLIFDTLPPGYEYPIPVDLESLEGRLIALITDPDAANAATLTGPIQYVGHMADNGQHLIVWEIDDGLGLSVLPGGASSCCGGTSEDYGMWLGAGDSSSAVIVVAVPLETSVVGITEPDGTRLWQRPIEGWGIFEVAEWPEGSPGPTIDAYDILGNEIGHWTIGSQTGQSDN
jgi:hypothetical protein